MKFSTYIIGYSIAIAALNLLAFYRYGESDEPFLWSTSAWLVVGQIVLMSCWMMWSGVSFIDKLRWSCLVWLVQWMSFVVPVSFLTKEWPMPWCLLADQAMVWSAAMAGAGLIRLIMRRKVSLPVRPNSNPECDDDMRLRKNPRVNFGILDLLILTSACGFFLALAMRFQDEIAPGFLAGFIYHIILFLGLIVGAPAGFLFAIFLTGFAIGDRRRFLFFISSWVILVGGSGLALVAASLPRRNIDEEIVFIGLPAIVPFLTLSGIGYLLRKNGYRWQERVKKSPEKNLS